MTHMISSVTKAANTASHLAASKEKKLKSQFFTEQIIEDKLMNIHFWAVFLTDSDTLIRSVRFAFISVQTTIGHIRYINNLT